MSDVPGPGVVLRPEVVHRLAVVLRFVDAFTGVPVDEPLEVRLGGNRWWRPAYRAADHTYRFSVTNSDVPALGPVDVEVASLGEPPRYEALEPVQVQVPPAGPRPTPLTATYFLGEHPLWPTRAFRPPVGETAVRGRVVDPGGPVAGARVALSQAAVPPPGTPIAYTDGDGEFTYRLPGARAVTVGDAVTTTVDLSVSVRDATDSVRAVAAPALPIALPIGRTTSLTITLT